MQIVIVLAFFVKPHPGFILYICDEETTFL